MTRPRPIQRDSTDVRRSLGATTAVGEVRKRRPRRSRARLLGFRCAEIATCLDPGVTNSPGVKPWEHSLREFIDGLCF
jgi:hypothetical protein